MITISPKRIFTGDKSAGPYFLGLAKEQLRQLKHQMANVRPRPLNEGFKTVKPYDNVVIEAWSSFKYSEVRVHVGEPVLGGRNFVVPEDEIKKECICLPHFAVGRILKVLPSLPVRSVDPDTGEWFYESDEEFTERMEAYVESLADTRFTYNMDVCSVSYYLYCEGIIDPNFGRYHQGQVVLVTVGASEPTWGDPLDCDRTCLLDTERFSTLAVSPISVVGIASQWRRA